MKKDLVWYAKTLLTSFVPKIDKALIQFWMEHKSHSIHHPLFTKSQKIQSIADELLNHIMEHNTRPAKRLRWSLIYYGYQLGLQELLTPSVEQQLLKASMSIEVVHTGLLVHDDFQDQDTVRRWLPTTHKHYENYHQQHLNQHTKEHFGASMAINVGDYALTQWYLLLLESGFDPLSTLAASRMLMEWVAQTLYGQSFDIILENTLECVEQDIYDLHHTKTWIYTYLTPLLVWATLSWLSQWLFDKLIEYAIPCGIAFQLQDDVIGLFGDEIKTWKSAYSDLKEGKKTLLMLKTMELCAPNEKEILLSLWWKADLTIDQAEYIRWIVKSSWALEYSYKKALEYAQKAQWVIQSLRLLDQSLNSDVLDYLEGIAEYMGIKREA